MATTTITGVDKPVTLVQPVDATGAIIGGSSSPHSVQSTVAEDSPATAHSAIGVALEARNTQKSAMSTNGDVVRAQGTMDGKQVVIPGAIPELTWSYAADASGIVNTTTAVTIKAAAGAGVRNYLRSLTIDHDALGAAIEFAVWDGAGGTVLWRSKLQTTAVEGTLVTFDPPLRGSANTLLEVVTLTAVTGGVYINATGFTAH